MALTYSILIHIGVLFFLSALNILPKPKALINLEVNYIRESLKNIVLVKKALKNNSTDELQKLGLKQRIILSEEDKILEKNSKLRQEFNRSDPFTKSKNALLKPSPPKTELLSRDDIKLSIAEPPKSQSAIYLNYRNFLHETLRRYLYDRYSDTMERGEVYLTFVLNADGSVRDAQIIDAKSNSGASLKRIVLESLYAASPFPPLPQTLNVPMSTFSVIIHFKEREVE